MMFEDMQKDNLIFIIKQQEKEIEALKEEIEYLEEQLYSAAHYPECEG